MFTCLLAGEMLQKENFSANALAASAFMLLCYDPLLIKDIGFQLSYAAVASIMLYYKSIGGIYDTEHPVLSFAWTSVATSVAAQILTTPLVLFHFHQFPLLFILSNLVAVPLSGIILILLILLCLVSPFDMVATPVGQLIEILSRVMNWQIDRLSATRFASIQEINMDIYDIAVSYCCIFLVTVYWKEKSPRILIVLLAVILLWVIKIRLVCG
jgi:competence protein ComEC